jgi:hypothetical protein
MLFSFGAARRRESCEHLAVSPMNGCLTLEDQRSLGLKGRIGGGAGFNSRNGNTQCYTPRYMDVTQTRSPNICG